ncbi:GNAT family N-acetyltransferase [Salinibius halmophilus]|uniref:GNAT family N-acetyltransferase n=1 Tax=Salinibius halmophilus TaxID=1853216 RepID=UPI001F4630EF|nr:GNAT family N-acetyltransferase [Salinibius halmophilus]
MALSAYRLSELTAEQLLHIMQARIDIFVVEQNCVYRDIDAIDWQALHVCDWHNHELAAYARVYEQDGFLCIGRVLSQRRGEGRARQLMTYCIEQLYPTRSIKISAQSYLTRFYHSLGFKSQGEPYLEDGIPHIDMLLAR